MRRLVWDPRTRADAALWTAQGKSKPEILRCLKRYLARDLYRLLVAPAPQRPPPDLGPPDPTCQQ